MDNTNFSQKKTKKYECNLCNFLSSNKRDFNIHLETKKHKMREIISNNNDFPQNLARFECECGKSYKHKPNLYAHRKKCDYEVKQLSILKENGEEGINYKEMFLQILKKTDTLHDLIIEQNKIIHEKDKTINELIPKIGSNTNISDTHGNNNLNTNSFNKNFNLCVFLNENFKDAISMDEFVKKIEVSLTDLLFTKQKGLVNGLSNIFVKNLNSLPIKKRPLWCGDKKRKKLFIKDEIWNEDVNNTKTKQAIKDVSKVQVKSIQKYTENNPDWKEKENKKEEYISIVKNATADINEKEEQVINKLIENIYFQNQNQNITE